MNLILFALMRRKSKKQVAFVVLFALFFMQLDIKSEFSCLFSILKEAPDSKKRNSIVFTYFASLRGNVPPLQCSQRVQSKSSSAKFSLSPSYGLWRRLEERGNILRELLLCSAQRDGFSLPLVRGTLTGPLRWVILEFERQRDCHLTQTLQVKMQGYVAGASHVW